jgi:DNA repair exonuclease SbcCD ATPase subunit
MKKIIFEKIEVYNFLSFGPDPAVLSFENGITFVTGINHDKDSKNGVGKTALLIESLSYVLFGETYRKIKVSNITNWSTKDQCVVKLWFKVNDDHYHVVRTANPSKVYLYKNPQNYKELKDADISRTIPETNKDILTILGISKSIFMHLIVNSNRASSFLSEGKEFRVKFMEGLLNLEIFSEMLIKAKELYNKKDKEVYTSSMNIAAFENLIKVDEMHQKRFKDKNISDIIDLSDKLSFYRSEQPPDHQEEATKLLDEFNKLKPVLIDLEDRLKHAHTKKAEVETVLKIDQTNLSGFNKKTCPTCKRPFDSHDSKEIEHEKKELQIKIQSHGENLKKLDNVIARLTGTIKEHKSRIDKINKIIVEFQKKEILFQGNANTIKLLEESLNKTKNEIDPFLDKIESNRQLLSKENQTHGVFEDELKVLEIVKLAASPNGIRALVIKKVINALNERINYYLKRLDAPVRLKFDEFFEHTIFTEKGIETEYGSLSGGEMKRVDFAMLFAWRDVRRIQSGITVNVSVFDELFDSAIDGKAMQDIMSLLEEMADGEGFYVVTHRESNIEINCKVINLEKRNNITRIVS